MGNKVRVRYAPSPTGMLHIGGARSALFNYLFAKKYDGSFIFRVEDTDIERNIEGGESSQYNDLLWLGIIPDESPTLPNIKYGPYRQTERLETYEKHAKWLLDNGYAYECYCSEEELQLSRDEQLNRGIAAPQYNRRCMHLSKEQIEQYRKEGRKPCLRLKVKDHHQISFDDLVRGKVSFNNDDIGDWVIVKSNGIPTYNFAVVIDDHLMDITHVFRGEEHLSNTPKQIQIYEYFDWKIPEFGHMTIIINENGKKLSKRDNNILQFMGQYRDLGYLPEAIFNFILLLGWTPSDEKEIFTLEEAKLAFDPKRLSSSPSTFDPKKLNWMNGQYIKSMSQEEYFKFIMPFVKQALDESKYSKDKLEFMASIFKEQLLFGKEIVALINEIFILNHEISEEEKVILDNPSSKNVLQAFSEMINESEDLESQTIKQIIKDISLRTSVKGKELYMPIRLALTGKSHGAELYNIVKALGKEETIKRLKR